MSNFNSPATSRTSPKRGFMDIWWGKIIFGIGCFGLAYVLHLGFVDLETGARESIRIPWYIAILYYTLGHIPTLAVIGLIGLVLMVVGLWQFAREEE